MSRRTLRRQVGHRSARDRRCAASARILRTSRTGTRRWHGRLNPPRPVDPEMRASAARRQRDRARGCGISLVAPRPSRRSARRPSCHLQRRRDDCQDLAAGGPVHRARNPQGERSRAVREARAGGTRPDVNAQHAAAPSGITQGSGNGRSGDRGRDAQGQLVELCTTTIFTNWMASMTRSGEVDAAGITNGGPPHPQDRVGHGAKEVTIGLLGSGFTHEARRRREVSRSTG